MSAKQERRRSISPSFTAELPCAKTTCVWCLSVLVTYIARPHVYWGHSAQGQKVDAKRCMLNFSISLYLQRTPKWRRTEGIVVSHVCAGKFFASFVTARDADAALSTSPSVCALSRSTFYMPTLRFRVLQLWIRQRGTRSLVYKGHHIRATFGGICFFRKK